MPFVVVAERGEYSCFNYEVISVYETEQAANDAVRKMERKDELDWMIARQYGKWANEPCTFEIVEVPSNETVDDSDITELEAELQKALEWRKAHDEEKERQKAIEKERHLDSLREQIGEFLEWWDTKRHLADKEKRKTRLGTITHIVKQYMLHRNDPEVSNILYFDP